MWKRILVATTLAVSLSACVTLYTKSRDWRLPGGLAQYVITATMNVGLISSEATIAVNGHEVLTGQSYFWSDVINMSGAVEGLPITAACSKSAKQCDVSILNIHAATLTF